jgi:hypothetical protein
MPKASLAKVPSGVSTTTKCPVDLTSCFFKKVIAAFLLGAEYILYIPELLALFASTPLSHSMEQTPWLEPDNFALYFFKNEKKLAICFVPNWTLAVYSSSL